MGRILKIGAIELRNKLVAAPMAGITDIGFRYLAMKMGAGLTVTEMATSKGLIQRNKRTLRTVATHPDSRPYAVQLFGNDPGILAEAARIAQEFGADIVDLNAACPAHKIVRNGSGAELLRDFPRFTHILRSMREVLTVPFTVKIRSGYNSESISAPEIVKIAAEEGVDALTLHPRTASQKFEGRADWSLIGEVMGVADIPIIAVGDICGPADALEVLDQTGCDGVMVGRAAMGDPFIFRRIAAALDGKAIPAEPTSSEKCESALEHLDIMLEYHDPKVAIALWRKHLCWYARCSRGASRLRSKVFTIWDVEELRELTRGFFGVFAESHQAVQGVVYEAR